MRYGIISDIHGNLEALETTLGELEGVDGYLCLGDVVGYGANPNECCQIVKGLKNSVIIYGNHDLAAIGQYDLSWFNPYARAAIQWTARQLSHENRKFLEGLPERHDHDLFTLVHGSLLDPPSEYITSPWEARESFQLLKTQIGFIGHTHIAECYIQKEGEMLCQQVPFIYGGIIQIEAGYKYIINCGSVGQPRDGNPRASFGIYDTETNRVEIKRIPYPIEKTQEKMKQASLPAILYLRLAEGY